MHEHGQEHESESMTYSKKHLLIMALCCLIPIAIILVIFYTNVERAYLPFLLIFLCPLLMLLMHLPRMLPRKKNKP